MAMKKMTQSTRYRLKKSEKKAVKKNKNKTHLKLVGESDSQVPHDLEQKAKGLWLSKPPAFTSAPVLLNGKNLTIDNIVAVAKFDHKSSVTNDKEILKKISASSKYIQDAVASNKHVYGITTSFGGLSHIRISQKDAEALQKNLFYFLKAGSGNKLPARHVRAGMLLRANSLLQGLSGIRIPIIQRLIDCLNYNITPVVREFGSIGASGDLIPLAAIGGAMIGLNSSYRVEFEGAEVNALEALASCHLPKIKLLPKEALAILNGTSVLTGIGSNCIFEAKLLLHLTLGINALIMQALMVSLQPFDLLAHKAKPHLGQYWTAKQMLSFLEGSELVAAENGDHSIESRGELIQDRYSSRCLPQYLGPVVDGLEAIAKQLVTEANSVTDNPLIDCERQTSLHQGNFLGEYPSVAMDQLRYYLGFLAKHLDVQIANVVAPAFNKGLPASLVGNTKKKINCGFKGLQLCSNSIMPVILFMGNAIANRYPTHAEEYNQNISSEGYESSIIASKTIEYYQQMVSIGLMFGVQAVGLRAYKNFGQYDPRPYISAKTAALYEVFFQLLGKRISKKRPYVYDDKDQSLEEHADIILQDIQQYGKLPSCIYNLLD